MKRLAVFALSGLWGFGLTPLVHAAETTLYVLKTTCSLDGVEEPCQVEAKDTPDFTLYTARLGSQDKTVRLGDRPALIGQIWNAATKSWQPLQTMSVDVANKLICYDKTFCMYNPNFISSLQENRPGFRQAQQQIRARFDATGRVNAICFDQGCDQPL